MLQRQSKQHRNNIETSIFRIKQDFTNWRGGFPAVAINDKRASDRGDHGGRLTHQLYFDKNTRLLVPIRSSG
jgi:hypothetical protein